MGGGARTGARERVIALSSCREVAIRRAERRDLASIVSIERASFSDPWTADAFEAALRTEAMRVFVAEAPAAGEGGGVAHVLGYVLALHLGAEGEIANLAVAPEGRRQGVGGVLLDSVIAMLEAGGVRALFLEVRESNRAARRLYESRGFTQIGRRRGYYQRPTEDALVLRREPTAI